MRGSVVGPAPLHEPGLRVGRQAGGAIRIHMRAPDGTVYPMTGTFQEVVEPERIVFTSARWTIKAIRCLRY